MMKRIHILMAAGLLAGAFASSCGTQGAATRSAKETTVSFPSALFAAVEAKADKGENVLVSPYSAAAALNLLREGAEGETAAEIQKMLGDFTLELPASGPVALTSVNSAWVNENYLVKAPYRQLLEERYQAKIANLDFSDPASPAVVNAWCAEKTQGKIQGIVDHFSGNDVLLLVNALHLKGAWNTRFMVSPRQKFYGTEGCEEVDMMHRNAYARYVCQNGAQMVEILFDGAEYAMYVVLPEKGKELGEVQYRELFNNLASEKVALSLPEFKVEFSASLKEELKQLGMKRAFTSAAELGKIGDGPLVVSDVNQKTYINVDKEGCEAAAVTSVSVGLTAVRPVRSIEMKVDRPFYYVISDTEGKHILFVGKLNHVK